MIKYLYFSLLFDPDLENFRCMVGDYANMDNNHIFYVDLHEVPAVALTMMELQIQEQEAQL